MTLTLPQPIAAYFAADRASGTTVADCFTFDAVVRDEGHTYRGIDEIRRWRAEAAAKYTYTCEPFSVSQDGETTVVTCRLEGNFPGSPADLRFNFRIADNKISALEVKP